MQLVDDEVFEAGGNRQTGGEFRGPEFLRRDEIRLFSRRRGRETAAHHVGINHHAATHGAVQCVHRSRPSGLSRIDGAFADLAAGKNIGAIDGLPLSVHDAIHVREAFETFQNLRCWPAFPDAVSRAGKSDHGLRRINPGAVIGNVAARSVCRRPLPRFARWAPRRQNAGRAWRFLPRSVCWLPSDDRK